MNLKNIIIECASKEELKAAAYFLQKMDDFHPSTIYLPTNIDTRSFEDLNTVYVFIGMGNIIDSASKSWINGHPECKVVLFKNIHTLLLLPKKENIKIKLNSDYTAVISKNGITVGCQTFSFETFEELKKGVDKYLKES